MNLKYRDMQRYLAILFPLAVTTILWLIAKSETPQVLKLSNLPLLVSQIFSLWGIVLLSINYIIPTRFRFIESLYGGLDKSYILHKYIGKFAFILILSHPLLLVVQHFSNTPEVLSLLLPLTGNTSVPKTFGVLALYFYTILVLISIVKLLPYEVWKRFHKLTGVAFIIAAYHALNAESDVKYFTPLLYWIGFWITIGTAAYIYKLLLYKHLSFHFPYEVEKIVPLGEVTELYLRPKDRRINFEPGEFIFLSVRGHENISSEEHPFTISSSPLKDYVRVTYKTFGNYTKSLDDHLKAGDHIEVYGPYGEFSSYMFDKYKKQIWISGGIGVASFLSMLEYESQNEDRKQIYFFYCNRNEQQCVYTEEIKEMAAHADDKIKFQTRLSDVEGMPTAEMFKKEVPDISEYLIMLSGPPIMVRLLRQGFLDMGVPEHMIAYEDFGFS